VCGWTSAGDVTQPDAIHIVCSSVLNVNKRTKASQVCHFSSFMTETSFRGWIYKYTYNMACWCCRLLFVYSRVRWRFIMASCF